MNVKDILAAKKGRRRHQHRTRPRRLAAAAKLLAEQRIGAVVIRGAGGRLAGILSERDIVRALARRRAPAALDLPVGAGDDPQGRRPAPRTTPCAEIMERMTAGKFRHLPVVRARQLVGIVSIGDVVKHRRRGDGARADGAARLHPDGVSAASITCAGVTVAGRGDSAAIASLIASSARSAASRADVDGLLRRGGNRTSRSWPSRGLISTSGGSPASRARVMRSCMTLKASIITVGMPGRPRRPKNCRLSARSAPNMPRRPPACGASSAGGSSLVVGAVAGDDGAAAEQVGVEIDGDDQPRAERARRRHRHRIDQRAVHQPAAADAHRRENSGQRVGGAHRVDQPAARQPDFVAGADFGGDGGKAHRQLVDAACRRAPRSSRVGELAAADQAGAGQADVEIAEHAAPVRLRAHSSSASSWPAA